MNSKSVLIFQLIFVTTISCETISKGQNITSKGVAKSSGYYQSCYLNSNCNGNMLCVDGYCRCPPNYSYSYSSETCNSFTCYLDSKCQDYDYNRECSYSSCVCKEGYIEDASNGRKCKQDDNGKSCTSDFSCSHTSQVCVDGRCRCAPNYKWSSASQLCSYFSCSSLSDCSNTWDIMRKCDYGSCDCMVGYTEDTSNGKKCKRVNDDDGKFCTSDSSCPHTNQLCVDNRCRCAPDYKWNSASQQCSYTSCDSILDCDKTWDSMRKCEFGRCVCWSDNWKENSGNGRKCEYDSGIPLGSWLWAPIVIPIVIIGITVGLVIHYRKRQALRQGNVVVYRY